jgi:hypothetical protein
VIHEQEFIEKAKVAADDRSGALTRNQIKQAIRQSGLTFEGDHGRAQLTANHRLGEGGKLGVLIGAAGAGKTTLLQPLVSAWQAQGKEVHGIALAWRQADDLTEAGIRKRDTKALSVFSKAVEKEQITLDRNAVVLVDELSLLGTRQGLDLVRLQEKHGFQLVMIGDNQQCQSIEAGGDYRTDPQGVGSGSGAGNPDDRSPADKAGAGGRGRVPGRKRRRCARHEARGSDRRISIR